MKDYEIAVLYHPDLETNLDPALDKVQKLIEANGGKIVEIEAEGKKKMAFSMKGQDFAIYYYYKVQLPAEAPNKVTAVMTITDEILRAQLVKADPRREEYQAYLKEKEAREAKEAEEKATENAEAAEADEAEATEAAENAENEATEAENSDNKEETEA